MYSVHKGEKWYLFAGKCDHMARERMKPRIHSLGSWLFVAYVQKRGIGGEHITSGEDEKKTWLNVKARGTGEPKLTSLPEGVVLMTKY